MSEREGRDIDVFMSYSHSADRELAPDLQRALSRLARPWNRPRALRVFRDRTDLGAAHDLTAEIESALSRSRYFLLLACPESAASPWVTKEIEYWKRHRSPESLLIAVTDGVVGWEDSDFDWTTTTALPDSLSGYFAAEPLWEDLSFARQDDKRSLRHSDFRAAVASLAARPHGRTKEQLDSEDIRQYRIDTRLRRIASIGLVLLLVVAVIAGIGFFVQRNDALRQRDVAVARELLSRSRLLTSTDPFGSRLTALAAWRLDPTPESRYEMMTAARNPRTKILTGHTGEITGAAVSPDGRTLATGGQDKTVRLWTSPPADLSVSP